MFVCCSLLQNKNIKRLGEQKIKRAQKICGEYRKNNNKRGDRGSLPACRKIDVPDLAFYFAKIIE